MIRFTASPSQPPLARSQIPSGVHLELEEMVSARLTPLEALHAATGSRTPLFAVTDFEPAVPHANYDVMPDGRGFVFVRQGRLSQFVYLQHWTGLLQQRVAVR